MSKFANQDEVYYKWVNPDLSSRHDAFFVYKVGSVVSVLDLDRSLSIQCSRGLHYTNLENLSNFATSGSVALAVKLCKDSQVIEFGEKARTDKLEVLEILTTEKLQELFSDLCIESGRYTYNKFIVPSRITCDIYQIRNEKDNVNVNTVNCTSFLAIGHSRIKEFSGTFTGTIPTVKMVYASIETANFSYACDLLILNHCVLTESLFPSSKSVPSLELLNCKVTDLSQYSVKNLSIKSCRITAKTKLPKNVTNISLSNTVFSTLNVRKAFIKYLRENSITVSSITQLGRNIKKELSNL